MIMFYEFIIVLCVGVFSVLCSGLALVFIFRKLDRKTFGASNKQTIDPRQQIQGMPKTFGLKTELNKAFVALSEDPGSKASKRIKLLLAVFGVILVQLFLGRFIFSFLSGCGGYFLIGSYFIKKKENEMQRFENQLIEAIGIITNSVRSGQSLLQALENMVKESRPPVSTEFAKALDQIKLGMPLHAALTDITKRINSKDLRIAITSINLAKETGANLGEILTRLSGTMRERHKLKGKIKALTAQGRASGVIIGCIPFLLLFILYFLEPSMFGLMFSTLTGNVLLVVVVLMVSLGLIVINKIIKIDI